MKACLAILERILKVGAVSSLTAMVANVLLQVFARVFLPQVPPWTEEASRLLFIYTVAFGAGLAIKEKAYVNVDTFLMLLSQRARKMLVIFLDIILMLFSGLLIYEAYKLVLAVEGQISAALLWPMEIFYGAIFLMVLFIGIYLIISILDGIKSFNTGDKAGETQ